MTLVECAKFRGLKLTAERCAQCHRDAQEHLAGKPSKDNWGNPVYQVITVHGRTIRRECLDCKTGRERAGELPPVDEPAEKPAQSKPRYRYVMRKPRGKRISFRSLWVGKYDSEGEWLQAMFAEYRSLDRVRAAIAGIGILVSKEALRKRAHQGGAQLLKMGRNK